MMKASYICSLLISIFFLSACTKEEAPKVTNQNEVEKIGIQKLTVLPADNINLADRKNWQLFVGSKKYNFLTNNKNVLTATPGDELFYFEYQGNVLNTEIRSLYVYFSSEEYCDQFGAKWSDSGPHFNRPKISDQSSVADLKKHDLLFGNYKGLMVPEISDLQLTHANALLDFNVTGKKKSDTIYIHDLKTVFLPCKVNEDRYKAIITGNWIGIETGHGSPLPPVMIEVRSLNKRYTVKLPDVSYPAVSNVKYTFNLSIDHSADTLSIKNTTRSIWDNEIFPEG